MNSPTLAMPGALSEARGRARGWWRGLQARERMVLGTGAAIVAAVLVWIAAVQPALRVAREAPAQLDQLDAELQRMQRTAAEIAALRATTPVTQAQAGAALKSATDRLGDKAKLMLLGERATLTLNGASPTAFQAWLGEVRSGARARPLEVQLSRSAAGLTGTVTLGLPPAGATP